MWPKRQWRDTPNRTIQSADRDLLAIFRVSKAKQVAFFFLPRLRQAVSFCEIENKIDAFAAGTFLAKTETTQLAFVRHRYLFNCRCSSVY